MCRMRKNALNFKNASPMNCYGEAFVDKKQNVMDEKLLNQLFEIALNFSATQVEIDPFFKLIVLKDSKLRVYDFNKNEIVLDDNYSSIELEYPEVFGVIKEEKVKLVLDDGKLKRKC